MIAFLKGKLVTVTQDRVVMDVGGVGYELLVPAQVIATAPGSGSELLLHTCLQVRDEEMHLYGFPDREHLEVFRLLLNVSGIGPKGALAIISALPPLRLRRAVGAEDLATLTAVPGIGKKTAQRLIIDLKDKLGSLDLVTEAAATGPAVTLAGDEAVEALVTLGYRTVEAQSAVAKARRELGAGASLEELVRAGLKGLSRHS